MAFSQEAQPACRLLVSYRPLAIQGGLNVPVAFFVFIKQGSSGPRTGGGKQAKPA